MSIEVTQELAARYGAAWAEHDLDAILAMHTDDTVFHLHGFSEPATGLAAVRQVIAATLPDRPTCASRRAGSTSAMDTSSASIG